MKITDAELLHANNSGWLDVSVAITDNMVHWPGDEAVQIKKTSVIKNGNGANVTAISMSAHTGTHVDAPLHFINGGNDITEIPFDRLMGKSKVFHIKDVQSITLESIRPLQIGKGDRILFRTQNSNHDWTRQPFNSKYVFLETDAANYLRNTGVVCIGVDYLSIGGQGNGQTIHELLLGAGISIIEGLNLMHIEAGIYDMICLPIKIKGADGAPARVLLKSLNN